MWAAIAALAIANISVTNAADVTIWSDFNTTENIELKNDIQVEGTPKVIPLNSANNQTIDGGGYSIFGDTGFSFSINSTGALIFKNLGAYSEGSTEAGTFSYTDLNNETKYINISASVNSFKDYCMTSWKPLTMNIENSVFADNGADRNARLIVVSSNQTLNIKDSIFYNNKTANNEAIIGGGKANINIENSIFYNNTNLTGQGGVITNTGTVTIKDSYFVNNHADDDWDGFGGAIQLSTGSTGTTIEGSKFEGNTAYYDGGVIAMEGGASGVSGVYIKYIKDSQFINN